MASPSLLFSSVVLPAAIVHCLLACGDFTAAVPASDTAPQKPVGTWWEEQLKTPHLSPSTFSVFAAWPSPLPSPPGSSAMGSSGYSFFPFSSAPSTTTPAPSDGNRSPFSFFSSFSPFTSGKNAPDAKDGVTQSSVGQPHPSPDADPSSVDTPSLFHPFAVPGSSPTSSSTSSPSAPEPESSLLPSFRGAPGHSAAPVERQEASPSFWSRGGGENGGTVPSHNGRETPAQPSPSFFGKTASGTSDSSDQHDGQHSSSSPSFWPVGSPSSLESSEDQKPVSPFWGVTNPKHSPFGSEEGVVKRKKFQLGDEVYVGRTSPETLLDRYGWILGILACLMGSFCGSLGDNMVRRSFVVLRDDVDLFQMWRSPLWAIGMFLTVVVNTVCTLFALLFAPATIVTAFAGVHIFWNTVLAKTLNREKAVLHDYIGIAAVVVGIVLIVIFSGKDKAVASVESFTFNLIQPGPTLYCLLLLFVVCFGSVVALCPSAVGLTPYRAGEDSGGTFSSSHSGERGGCFDVSLSHVVERFAIAATSGACGGLSNVFAKAVLLLAHAAASPVRDKESIMRENGSSWGYGWTAGSLVMITAIVSVMQLVFLNASLQRFEAIYVVPIINSVLIATGALGGVILFREVPQNPPVFALGLALVVTGVVALSYGKYEAEKRQVEEDLSRGEAFARTGNADPLLPRGRSEGSLFDEGASGGRGGMSRGGGQPAEGCWDALLRPLTDASVNILVRNNTMNASYPPTLVRAGTSERNASLKVLRKASMDSRSGAAAWTRGGELRRMGSPAAQSGSGSAHGSNRGSDGG
ncbi:magnesium transporter nipa [Cystoisospora suis]|uniref:Magnesium transporter nipa n=1 Tax=Cystoisospora suis TaxID=483139 RepID=A0A2C6L4W7_9APIC|nr:magnesium transporter nipa [Cystoisospora suis]